MLARIKALQYFHAPNVPIVPKQVITVRKTFFPFFIIGCLSFTYPMVKAGGKDVATNASASVKTIINTTSLRTTKDKDASLKAASTKLYDSLQLDKLGLSYNALQYAYKGYQYLMDKGVLQNSDILTVVDFSQSSRKKRMYIIDVKNFKVLKNTYVAHGKNTGVDIAKKFSNIPESLQSSLGFYVTKATYFGKHGLSLRLDGLERGFNDKAEARAVVLHGANYIGEHRKGAAYMGRSFGCPAVPQAQAKEIINTIKNGSCLFIYHPSASYLHGSTILNG